MVFFNHVAKQMAAKIVYYGPAFGGKTTNLQYIHAKTAENMRGEMVSLETETDRTIFFDLLPIIYGDFQGYQTRFLLYTVPGQVYYNNTRKLVLQGVDGIVFVADSQLMSENVESLRNLQENLSEMDVDMGKIPMVFQFNKRDLKNILSVSELQKALNPAKRPYFEATALYGPGVFETLKGLSQLTLDGLQDKLGERGPRPSADSQKEKASAKAEEAKSSPKVKAPAAKEKSEPARSGAVAPRRPEVNKGAPRVESTPPSGIAIDFDHEPAEQKGKSQKTQVEYTRIALSKGSDIDRELDRLRKATIQKPVKPREPTDELAPDSVARAKARAAGAAPGPGASDGRRVLRVPVSPKDVGKVQSVKIHVILEGERLSAEYKKGFRIAVNEPAKGEDSRDVGLKLDIRLEPT